VWFDKELRETLRRLRQGIPAYILEGHFVSLLTAPVIQSLLLPRALPLQFLATEGHCDQASWSVSAEDGFSASTR
jgi:hypothetical protein